MVGICQQVPIHSWLVITVIGITPWEVSDLYLISITCSPDQFAVGDAQWCKGHDSWEINCLLTGLSFMATTIIPLCDHELCYDDPFISFYYFTK